MYELKVDMVKDINFRELANEFDDGYKNIFNLNGE